MHRTMLFLSTIFLSPIDLIFVGKLVEGESNLPHSPVDLKSDNIVEREDDCNSDSFEEENYRKSDSNIHVPQNSVISSGRDSHLVPQYDGNMSIPNSEVTSDDTTDVSTPVENNAKSQYSRKSSGRFLPSFCVYNCRSFPPKAKAFAEDMDNRAYKYGFLSEIWEEDSKDSHIHVIEKLIEEDQIII